MSLRLGSAVALTFALWVGSACSELASQSSESPTPSATRSSSPSPPASPDVALLPAGFPTDFPIYPGSRLSQAGKFAANGSTNWGVEWHTRDGAGKVQPFFVGKLSSGDWTLLSNTGSASTSFSDSFRRKNDPKTTGTLRIASSAGVTKISLVLTTSP
jgi:hypothetical protein